MPYGNGSTLSSTSRGGATPPWRSSTANSSAPPSCSLRSGRYPDEARARLRPAERLVADGRRAEADVQLDKVLAFYRSVDATRYIRDGEALLAVSA
jgi:hypothetical protein